MKFNPTESKSGPLNILVVDDEANIRKTLSYCLTAEGHSVTGVSNPEDAMEETLNRSYDLVFLDVKLKDNDGLELIPALLSNAPWIKIVVITAFASIESAVEAMKRGAADYIPKPFTPDQIRLMAFKIGRIRELENKLAVFHEKMPGSGPEDKLRSQNPGMQRLIETVKKVAASEAVVLFQGESGAGKSVLAKAIHQWSPRAGKPMAVVSCPSLPSGLLESELFGHVKGAFTGAVRDNPGRIAACEGGALFLDEIGDMPLEVQAKLLRFIQDRDYERIGDSKTRKADVRIITATNADLEKQVSEGRFREDLFYRLNGITLTIPPLRERPEDIGPLAEDFLAYFCQANHKTFLGFTPEAEKSLLNHAWPGNVRELRNAIERAVILESGDYIGKTHLPGHPVPASGKAAIGDPVSLTVLEEQHIRSVLASSPSLQEAADILGIDQATLWRRRKTYGI
jgi:NtrC-family two-component system response regulator AlgB